MTSWAISVKLLRRGKMCAWFDILLEPPATAILTIFSGVGKLTCR